MTSHVIFDSYFLVIQLRLSMDLSKFYIHFTHFVGKDSPPQKTCQILQVSHFLLHADTLHVHFLFKFCFQITSTYTVQSALPFYVPSSAQPSARCGAVSWSSNHTTYVWAGLGFDVHQRLWYRNDLWRLNTVPRPITTPTVALKQTTVTLPGSWIQTLSPSNVFLLCFTAMSGTALMFGLVLFLKKMFVDYPQHTPSRNFKVRYSPLTQEALFENGGI